MPKPRLDELIELAARALRQRRKKSTAWEAGGGRTESLMLLVFFPVFVLCLTHFRLDKGLWISHFIQCG